MAKSKKYKKIRESLINQLESKGANVPHFESLIDDYMNLFEVKEKLIKDIKNKGMSYPAVSSAGKEYEKDNPSIKLLPQYNRQMLSILKELGLTTSAVDEIDSGEAGYL